MSENDPWKKVGTYAADICLDDGDLIDVDVCLRTEVDAARAAEATQHQQFKEAVATALCVENEHGPVTEESIVEAADATLSQLFDLSGRLATLRAERDRLKAALSTAAFALDLAGFRRDRDAAYAALTPQESTDGETR